MTFATLLAELQGQDRAAGARSCRLCGCTERYACYEGCRWVGDDLCSQCASIEALGLDDRPLAHRGRR